MRIKYKLIDQLKYCTRAEMDFLLYIARKQDLSGRVVGVHNQDVCRHTGMCKQSFYTAMRGLEEKGILSVSRSSDIDYDILIIGNSFEEEGSFQEGYINLQRSVFHQKAFQKLKAKEKWMLLYFLHITHENSSSYRTGTKTFYEKFSGILGVTKRVVRSYLHHMRQFFSVGILNGLYYITYRHSIFEPRDKVGTETVEHRNFVEVQARRNKIKHPSEKEIHDTASLVKQYRQIAGIANRNIFDILKKCIRTAAGEDKRPKDRRLNPKYIHKLVRRELALD